MTPLTQEEVRTRYNTSIPDRYEHEYELERWHSTSERRSHYRMTHESILRILKGQLCPKHYLEVGPGHGTWTKVFLSHCEDTQMSLVDISREMLGIAEKALEGYSNITYHESDFLAFTPPMTYDYFFSSRALEYIPDKNEFVRKLSHLLTGGAKVCIITKMPHYGRQRFTGKQVATFHSGQIEPEELASLFHEYGFSHIHTHPVTFVVPLLRLGFLNTVLWHMFRRFPCNPFSNFFSESYMLTAQKNPS